MSCNPLDRSMAQPSQPATVSHDTCEGVKPAAYPTAEVEAFIAREYSNLSPYERAQFFQAAKDSGLNPIKKEIYAIPYAGKLSFITSYQVYIERAECTGKMNGFKTFFNGEGDGLTCTLIVNRKDWEYPFEHTVRLSDAKKTSPFWKAMPGTMLDKVAISQGLRICFPATMKGIPYAREEIEAGESQPQTRPATTPEQEKPAKPGGAECWEVERKTLLSSIQASLDAQSNGKFLLGQKEYDLVQSKLASVPQDASGIEPLVKLDEWLKKKIDALRAGVSPASGGEAPAKPAESETQQARLQAQEPQSQAEDKPAEREETPPQADTRSAESDTPKPDAKPVVSKTEQTPSQKAKLEQATRGYGWWKDITGQAKKEASLIAASGKETTPGEGAGSQDKAPASTPGGRVAQTPAGEAESPPDATSGRLVYRLPRKTDKADRGESPPIDDWEVAGEGYRLTGKGLARQAEDDVEEVEEDMAAAEAEYAGYAGEL